MRARRVVGLTAAALLVAGGVAGAWALTRSAAAEPAVAPQGPAHTAEVTRGTVTDARTWDATLGFGDPFTVRAAAQGVVTWVADQGAPAEPGAVLVRVAQQPTIVLAGTVPMYRELRAGSTGADVAQLEAGLAAMGYEGFTADDSYTPKTADAVRRWQEDVGATVTGAVPLSAVVFLAEPGRVDSRWVRAGDLVSPGAALLDVTGTAHVVSLTADVADRNVLAVGTPATVTLAGGEEVTGAVTSLQVVAAPETAGGAGGGGLGGESGAEESSLAVEITLDAPAAPELVGSPVDVAVVVEERADVLVVPVNALLALAEGGYGLEVVADDGTTRVVAVEAGLFADGVVEVSGPALREGMTVGTAAR